MTKRNGKGTFIVQVISQKNADWQGVVTWTEGRNSQPFRSALELIKMIDGALTAGAGDREEHNQA